MDDNLRIYKAMQTPPSEALKPIQGGRMKGKTDINPMWRLKALTEEFGPCGIGWKYEITKQWLETGAKDEVSAFCNINLFIKDGEAWSEAIPGTGGSAFVANEKGGLFTSDECFKMALTDALSVACKALGVAGDIYWQNDPSKYSREPAKEYKCHDCGEPFVEFTDKNGKKWNAGQVYHMAENNNADKVARCKKCRMKKEGKNE